MKKSVLLLLSLALILGSLALIFTGCKPKETGPIKVGMYADLSAGTAQWGTDAEKGARLRIKEVNADGGIMGRQVELQIRDDGRGFDPEAIGPDHLGLGIMRERAEAIGARLQVETEIGSGTLVSLTWAEDGDAAGAAGR